MGRSLDETKIDNNIQHTIYKWESHVSGTLDSAQEVSHLSNPNFLLRLDLVYTIAWQPKLMHSRCMLQDCMWSNASAWFFMFPMSLFWHQNFHSDHMVGPLAKVCLSICAWPCRRHAGLEGSKLLLLLVFHWESPYCWHQCQCHHCIDIISAQHKIRWSCSQHSGWSVHSLYWSLWIPAHQCEQCAIVTQGMDTRHTTAGEESYDQLLDKTLFSSRTFRGPQGKNYRTINQAFLQS